MKTFACCIAALSISLSSTSAYAQTALQYPQTNLPDRGARLGISVDGPYAWKGINVIKVLDVARDSGLYGVIYPGDYIYGVNGFNLRNPDDISAIVSPGTPGALATVYYFETRNNYRAMKVTVRADWSAGSKQIASSRQENTSASFCEEHYIICGVGLVVGAAVVASAVAGSSGSSSSSARSAPDDPDLYRQKKDNSASSNPPAASPRTYGLYGDCPQPGAGYGC